MAGALGGLGALVQFKTAVRPGKALFQSILKGVGGFLLASAQKAFKDQALGEKRWPERYPRQKEPFANIAGIVADFLEGRKQPPERRFQRRPAGIDTGELLRSLTPGRSMKTETKAVVVGSNVKHAAKVHFGGESKQTLTKDFKDALGEYLKKSRRRTKTAKKKSQPMTARDAASSKLGFLMNKKRTELLTKSAARPYLGVTKEVEDKIVDYVVERFALAAPSDVRIKKA